MNTEENCQKQDRRGENMVLAVETGVVSAEWGEKQGDTMEDGRTEYKAGGNGRGQGGPVG